MTPSAYMIPGLIPKISPCFIPGYIGDVSGVPPIKNIYSQVLRYFNKHTHDFERRYRDYVLVRYWTMFIAMCLGYKSTTVGLFFKKDHSTVLHAGNRMIGEIKHYNDSRKTFEYFSSVYTIDPENIQSNKIKQFLTTWKNNQNM